MRRKTLTAEQAMQTVLGHVATQGTPPEARSLGGLKTRMNRRQQRKFSSLLGAYRKNFDLLRSRLGKPSKRTKCFKVLDACPPIALGGDKYLLVQTQRHPTTRDSLLSLRVCRLIVKEDREILRPTSQGCVLPLWSGKMVIQAIESMVK